LTLKSNLNHKGRYQGFSTAGLQMYK